MKTPDELVFASAIEMVANENARLLFVDEAFPGVTDGRRKPLVAAVTAAKPVDLFAAAHRCADRLGVVAQLQDRVRREKSIQLLVVNLHGVVESGASKSIQPLARGGVQVRAAVGDDIEAVQEQLEAQDVVVAM